MARLISVIASRRKCHHSANPALSSSGSDVRLSSPHRRDRLAPTKHPPSDVPVHPRPPVRDVRFAHPQTRGPLSSRAPSKCRSSRVRSRALRDLRSPHHGAPTCRSVRTSRLDQCRSVHAFGIARTARLCLPMSVQGHIWVLDRGSTDVSPSWPAVGPPLGPPFDACGGHCWSSCHRRSNSKGNTPVS